MKNIWSASLVRKQIKSLVFAAVAVAGSSALSAALPKGYAERDYIQGDRTTNARIVTDFIPNPSTDKIVAEVEFPNVNAVSRTIWCARGSTTTTRTWTLFSLNGTSLRFDYYDDVSDEMKKAVEANTRYLATAENEKFTWSLAAEPKTTIASMTMTQQVGFTAAGGPLALFASYWNGTGNNVGNYSDHKLYSFKVYRSGELIHDLRPCTDANGKATLCDVAGSMKITVNGTLVAGPKVFGETTTATYADGTLTVSSVIDRLPAGTADLYVRLTDCDGTVTDKLLAEGASVRDTPYVLAIDGLQANASCLYQVVARTGETEYAGEEKTLYTGTVSIEKGASADINFGQSGTFVISRGESASATEYPLVVSYTVSGTAEAGVDYAELSGEVTIPAGASSAAVTVTPIAHDGGSDVTLTLALASGGYAIAATGASASATLPKLTETWTYDAAGTITDGTWTLTVKASSKNLTVKGVSSQGDGVVSLNLAKPVFDASKAVYQITAIAGQTFMNRTTLREVFLPETLTTIEYSAFSGCTALTSVTPLIPETVTYLGYGAFKSCPIAADTLSLGRTRAITIQTSGGDNYSGTFIGANIRHLILGPYVTRVGASLVASCTNLASVVFEGDVTTVYGSAFYGCTALTNVTPLLPPTVSYIGTYAFMNCPIEGRLALGEETAVSFGTVGGQSTSQAFYNTKISECVIGERTKTVPADFLGGSTALTNVVLHDAITAIGGGAFKGCTALRTVSPLLPRALSSIGLQTFMNCPLEGTLRFGGDRGVSQATVGGGNVNESFAATRITDFIVGTNVTTLANSLCYGSSLGSADLTAATNLTSIGNAFNNCASLTNVVFAEVKPTFGGSAFANGPADYASRFLFSKKSKAWSDYIASLGTGFKTWSSNVTENEKAAYAAAFSDGLEPRGYATVNGRKKWFVPYSDAVAGRVQVRIVSEPEGLGTATPDYGDRGVVTTPYAASVSQYGEQDLVAYESYGYRIDKMGDEFWEEVETVLDRRSVDFAPGEDGEYRIVWLFRPVAYALDTAAIAPAYGSVAVSGTVLDAPSLAKTYYVSNTVATLTATDGSLAFKRWYGEVVPGEETARTISITMDHPCAVDAYFATPWTYDSNAKTLSDGYWTLNTSGGQSSLTVSSVAVRPSALTILDLTKGMGGCSVTAIGGGAFNNNSTLEEVRLPESLTSIGASAFSGCTSLRTVAPFLPEAVTYIGTDAFNGCPVAADTLSLGRTRAITIQISGGGNYSGTFIGANIRHLILGPYVTRVGASLVASCTNLATVVFEGDIASIYGSAFYGCTALTNVTPLLPPTVSYIGTYAFMNCPIEGRLALGEETAVSFGTVGGQNTSQAFYNTKIGEFIAGPKLTYLPTGFFEGSTALTNAVLHDAVTGIDRAVFKNCTALKTVKPLLPKSLNYIGPQSFLGSAVEGSVTIGSETDFTWGYDGGNRQNVSFGGTKITELHVGAAATSVPGYFCENCAELASAYFEGYPEFGNCVFSGVSSDARFFLSRDVAEWDAWLANESNAKAWKNLTDEERQEYFAVYGAGAKRPKARALVANQPFPKGAWLLRYSPREGFSIIVR